MTGFRPPPTTSPLDRQASNGWSAGPSRAAERGTAGERLPGGRRRSPPHLLVGALLVVACAIGFAVAASRVDHRSSVLALARAVAVGQRLTNADLRSVRVSVGSGVATIPDSQLSTVVGDTVAMPLPAGALLTRAELGSVDLPAGQAVVAVAVKSGQAPPGLAAGEHVLLIPTGTTSSGTSGGTSGAVGSRGSAGATAASWPGVVTGVALASSVEDTTVVSIQLPTAVAQLVAGLPTGQVDLVLVPGS